MKIGLVFLPDYYLNIRRFCYIILFIVVSLLSCRRKESKADPNLRSVDNNQLFTLLDSKSTGIDFTNNVVDGEKFNVITYRNFYNGGGVAIGDINNDGLADIYFTSNQGKNKLYLNEGNFVFEDITEKAGVGGTKVWSTGVTMADVNGDGFLDIYVCNSGDVEPEERENELFINNGDLTFTERAKEFNLNNDGYSTQAAFFDYDQDGDLDCYIANNNLPDPSKIDLYKKIREIPYEGGDKLMRNDGGIFRDVSKEAGIYSSNIGFGNGVAIGDVNNDNLPDIYIANDFWERDYLYINQGNGKFSEEFIKRFNYCSTSSMGGDIADLNNDGNPDIITTDMLPADNYRLKTTISFDPYHPEDIRYRENFYYQITQNCLHLNDGNGFFQEIGLLSGIAATDWSWGALIFDFENDGNKDIFISNGILRDIMSNDFLEFYADKEKRKKIITSKGKFDYRDFISLMPSQPLKNYAFINSGNLKFQNRAKELGLGEPSFSNGAAYGDLDNDGDLDLVVNNVNSQSFIYRNESNTKSGNHFLKVRFNGSENNRFGIGAGVTLKIKEEIRVLQNYNTRGFESSIEPNLVFGLSKAENIDELKVKWPDGKVQVLANVKPDQTITLNYKDASVIASIREKESSPEFEEISQKVINGDARHHENRYNDFDQEILLPRMLSTEGPRLVIGDVNNDKLDDFILLGAAGDPDKLFIQQADGSFNFKATPAFLKDAGFESTCGALFDMDYDGDLDLMIGSGGNDVLVDKLSYIVRVYKNDGKGNFSADPSRIPKIIGNFSTIETADFDKDGNTEIFLGARCVPGNYSLPPQSYLLKNDNGNWIDIAPPSLGNIGMVTDAAWADVNADGYKDLVVVGDWMGINIFKNENGVLINPIVVPDSKGWWTRIEAADLDKDGNVDFVLGNWGLNSKFKASAAKPLTMFVNDFDNNGKSEFIINWYPPLDSVAYPFAQKQELIAQLPGLGKTILTYEDYARKTYDSLFSPAIQAKSIQYKVSYLESAILWNTGKSFSLEALPVEAQDSPVFGIVADDLDGDGITDIWLGGNFYSLKPQVGRNDASRGVLLKGGPKRSFLYQPQPHSGLYVEGEVRDASMIKSNQSKRLIVARIVDEVDSILIDEARTPLIISAPDAESSKWYQEFAKIIPNLDPKTDYEIDEKMRASTLTESGINKIEKILGSKNIYEEKGIKYLHHLEQSLKAEALFKRDTDYVVKDGQIIIVDEFTGRLMPGRRWSGGLHQAIEAKEGVQVQPESLTLASVTFQNYFRLYKKLAGMTGTASTSAEEFDKVYKMEVALIPTNKPQIRKDLPDKIYKSLEGKFQAVTQEIKEKNKTGQPVLVGTTSIEKNEYLGKLLDREGVPHRILNAKHHEKEGEIIAQAGKLGQVTIATNMAGRGVDIILGGNPSNAEEAQKVRELGGLHIIGTERHEARRIDNQLRGRTGRQGDPGSSTFFVSLEDDLMRIFGGDRIKSLMNTLKIPEDQPIEAGLVSRVIEDAQSKIEGMNFDLRKHVLDYDDVLNKHREVIYKKRTEIIETKDWKEQVSGWMKNDEEKKALAEKEKELGEHFNSVVKLISLRTLDMLWIEHLENMEYLRDSVKLRAYGQQDPLVEYKNEGHKMFRDLLSTMESMTASTLLKVGLTKEPQKPLNQPVKNKTGQEVGRNDPCYCNSGKKFKKCHGK